MKDIFVIVPVYNEENRAIKTISEILKIDKKLNIVIVDDGSTDLSLKMIKEKFQKNARIIIFSHGKNLGKGAAMKMGLRIALKLGANKIIFIDADGQHNPKYLPKFIKELKKKPIVFGYRVQNKNTPWIRRIGNKFAGWLVGILFNIKRKDLLCGFFGFRREIYKQIKWRSYRYGIETEIATKVGKNKLPFSEVKIDTIYINKYKGVTVIDALKIFMRIPLWYFLK